MQNDPGWPGFEYTEGPVIKCRRARYSEAEGPGFRCRRTLVSNAKRLALGYRGGGSKLDVTKCQFSKFQPFPIKQILPQWGPHIVWRSISRGKIKQFNLAHQFLTLLFYHNMPLSDLVNFICDLEIFKLRLLNYIVLNSMIQNPMLCKVTFSKVNLAKV